MDMDKSDASCDETVSAESTTAVAGKSTVKVAAKKEKRGVIYLPSIPEGKDMTHVVLTSIVSLTRVSLPLMFTSSFLQE